MFFSCFFMIFPQNEVFSHCQVSLLELDGLILEVTYSILRILKMDDPFTEPFCDPMAPSIESHGIPPSFG